MQSSNIKRSMLTIVSFLLITTSVQAQPGRGQQELPALPNRAQITDMIEELDQALELTTSQKTQISGLYFAHFEEAQALQDAGKTSRKVMDNLKEPCRMCRSFFEVITGDQIFCKIALGVKRGICKP